MEPGGPATASLSAARRGASATLSGVATVSLDAPRVPRRATAARRGRPWLLVAGIYLGASLALHHRVLGALASSATGSVSSDSGLFTWWLEWTWWALSHGHNPLYTTWQNAPAGVNAMWNTTAPVLGVLLAPITATAGPTAAFNVGMILGPVASALACYIVLRPWVERWWARLVAGAMFGFGPFLIAHAWVGHLNLAWTVLPPALLWAVDAILVRPRQPWASGAVLGLIFAVQTGLYTQTVALGALALLTTAVVLAARWPREAWARAPQIARAAGACAAVYLAVCAYPLWLLLAGPGRPRAPIRDATQMGADAANLVVPTPLTALHAGSADLAAQMRAYPGEQGSYLGIALLLVVVAAVITARSTAIRLTAVIGSALAVLSLGTSLTVLGHDTGLALPWAALLGAPLVGEAEAGRLAPFVALCVAVIVALVLDHAADRRRWIAVGLVLLATATWLPSDSQQTTTTSVPPFFPHAAQYLGPGEIVETWPRPSGWWDVGADPLVWQAASAMAYRQTGGYFIGSDPSHRLLLEGAVSEYQRGAAGQPVDPALARSDLRAHAVSTVLVVPRPDVNMRVALEWTRRVTGAPGALVEGVWLFPLAQH